MLAGVAGKLWQQAPIQLPQGLSPRHAWLLAESVRRTINVCFMLHSAYSLSTRNYSVRTPFVDSCRSICGRICGTMIQRSRGKGRSRILMVLWFHCMSGLMDWLRAVFMMFPFSVD
jgi:hypothetical protein